VRARGEEVCGRVACLRSENDFCEYGADETTPKESWTSYGLIETDNDFGASCLFLLCSIKSGSCSLPDDKVEGGCCGLPMRFFLRGASSIIPFCFVAEGKGTARLRGVPGEVGGLARGAELMECEPRLCEYGLGLAEIVSGDRVFVKVILTENGSPAKKADWEGVTTIRSGESASPMVKLGIPVRSRDTSS
jgi:hypothetical protein